MFRIAGGQEGDPETRAEGLQRVSAEQSGAARIQSGHQWSLHTSHGQISLYSQYTREGFLYKDVILRLYSKSFPSIQILMM